jgi:hypothetical protein
LAPRHPRRRPSLDIDYENTANDLYAFQWRAVFESPRGRRLRRNGYVLWLVALALFALVPAINADGFHFTRIGFVFLAVTVPVMLLLQWVLERWLIRRFLRQMLKDERPGRGALGRHRVALSDYGVTETSAVNETRTAWAGVDRVEQSPEHIFIYITPASAHVIPKRAFPTPDAAEAFYQLARSRRESAG